MNDQRTHSGRYIIFLYWLFQYKLHVVNYLAAACITMKVGLQSECRSVVSKYVNCCLFPRHRLPQQQQLPIVITATHACTDHLPVLSISILIRDACYIGLQSTVSSRCELNPLTARYFFRKYNLVPDKFFRFSSLVPDKIFGFSLLVPAKF